MVTDGDRGPYQYEVEKVHLGVIVLVALLFLLYQCTRDSGLIGTTSPDLASLGTHLTSTEDPPAPSASDSELTAGGVALLPLSVSAAADGGLEAFAGEPAVARGVTVLSVTADEGFWVGTSSTDRVWVQLNGSGVSPYTVRAGDRAHFTGVVVGHSAEYARRACAGDDRSVDLLAAQQAHIEVPQDQLTLNP